MKRVLYIHLGPGKTGTTAIQKFLCDNRPLLEHAGIYYPDLNHPSFPGPQKPFKIASHLLAWKNGFGPSSMIENAQNIDNNWFTKRIDKNFPKVVLTSEYFTGRVTREKILNLKEYVSGLNFDEVKVIYYFRRPDIYLESIYQQSVRNHGIYGNVFESINKIEQVYMVFNLYSQLFGPENMIVRVYEKDQFSHGHIFADFLRAMEEEWSDDFVIPHKNSTNVGWHKDLILIMRMVNESIQDREGRESIRKLLALVFRRLYSTNKQNYGLLSFDQRKQIDSTYKEKNAAIARDYLGRPDGRLFYESIAEDQLSGLNISLSVEDASKIVSYIHDKNSCISPAFKKAIKKGLVSENKELSHTATVLSLCLENL